MDISTFHCREAGFNFILLCNGKWLKMLVHVAGTCATHLCDQDASYLERIQQVVAKEMSLHLVVMLES